MYLTTQMVANTNYSLVKPKTVIDFGKTSEFISKPSTVSRRNEKAHVKQPFYWKFLFRTSYLKKTFFGQKWLML